MIPRITIVERQPPIGARLWAPFEPVRGFNSSWWSQRKSVKHNATHLQALAHGEEVARIELDEAIHPDEWLDGARLRARPLEIQFFEVRFDQRLQGVGAATIDVLQTLYPDRVLVAFSERADDFWESIGWSRHVHREDDGISPGHQPLYVATGGLDR